MWPSKRCLTNVIELVGDLVTLAMVLVGVSGDEMAEDRYNTKVLLAKHLHVQGTQLVQ